ncbi:hypothetical protein GH741_17755 [Aquibacillus halophilus]|uniref:NAD(P)-binding protein n=1 Tax=Aquibacillus halophilus TaxID=930132 RepID=A0A6A8DFT5_9BACI|nr:NAD(P)-binding domain-containing protein [Aquibacillus halophilus]MRH44493.1 hypothetical protein [Aquibacillus halophilus]
MIETNSNLNEMLPVAVIGAGPVGLAAASHLINKGEKVIILEFGKKVGANILKWAHVRLFSPWKYNMDKEAIKLLIENGWVSPDLDELPTGKELLDSYLYPLSQIPQIEESLFLNTKVVGITRMGLDKVKDRNRENLPFEIYVEQDGISKIVRARTVIDATGTWSNPNPVLSSGVWTSSEQSLRDNIYYGIPDVLGKNLERYVGQKIIVVGSGHSAINSILDLGYLKDRYPKTEIIWAIRKEKVNDVYGGQEKDNLAARGELGTRIQELVESGKINVKTGFYITELVKENNNILVRGIENGVPASISGIGQIITGTGARPDISFLREVRTNLDSAIESVSKLAPLIDPNVHSCGTVRPHGEEVLRQPEENFYIIGMKSYGRAPTFLMATGYEQARSIVSYLVGDFDAAKEVHLELPETGVCSINRAPCCQPETMENKVIIQSGLEVEKLSITDSSSCYNPTNKIEDDNIENKEQGCCG